MIKKTLMICMAVMLFLSAGLCAEASQLDKLAAFGIADTGELRDSNREITRSELAKYAVKLSGFDEKAFAGAMPFDDITPSYENYEFVAAAYNLGFFSGTADDKFSPNSTVTKEQTAKVIVTVLGYNELAESKGG